MINLRLVQTMGGAVSAGKNNEELVNNLCYEDYIQTPDVEKVFRVVDRGDYMTFREDDDRYMEVSILQSGVLRQLFIMMHKLFTS